MMTMMTTYNYVVDSPFAVSSLMLYVFKRRKESRCPNNSFSLTHLSIIVVRKVKCTGNIIKDSAMHSILKKLLFFRYLLSHIWWT